MAGGDPRAGSGTSGSDKAGVVSEAPQAGPIESESVALLALKRSAEMAAVFMIGDGALGLLQASRHVELWRSTLPAVDVLVRPFAGEPGRRRAYALAQIAAGLALAARLRRKA